MRLREPLFAFALTRPFKLTVNTHKKKSRFVLLSETLAPNLAANRRISGKTVQMGVDGASWCSRPHHPAVIPLVSAMPGGGGGCCTVYFPVISTAHFHPFTAQGVGSQFVIWVHSTPAHSTTFQSLS